MRLNTTIIGSMYGRHRFAANHRGIMSNEIGQGSCTYFRSSAKTAIGPVDDVGQ
jgi:Na+/alanine symporter